MYMLNVGRLREDLVHDRVDQADFAIYAFLVSGVALPIYAMRPLGSFSAFEAIAITSTLAFTAISIVGTRACYLANGGADGSRFVDRFISLGWVVGVRVALLLAIPLMLLHFALALSGVKPFWIADAALQLGESAGVALYYWRLAVQMALVRSAADPAA